MIVKLNLLSLAFALMKLEKIRRDSLFLLLKEELNMALNDPFKILPQNTISLEDDLNSYLPKKKNAFSIATKIYFFYVNL